MPSLSERIEAINRANALKEQNRRSVPLVYFYKKMKFVYGDRLPECPLGSDYYPAIINKDGTAYADCLDSKYHHYDKISMFGLKKPGFFKRKKKQEVELFFINKKINNYNWLVFCKALDRTNQSEMPAKSTVHFTIKAHGFDGIAFKKWYKKLKNAEPKEESVLMTIGNLEDILKYNISFGLGDLLKNHLISQGELNLYGTKLGSFIEENITKAINDVGFSKAYREKLFSIRKS